MSTRLRLCEACNGTAHTYSDNNAWRKKVTGICPACEGSGLNMTMTEAIDLELRSTTTATPDEVREAGAA